jgi:ABC-type transport system substrate-binding protein
MAMQPEDILPAKRDLPGISMFANEEFTQAGDYIRFGWIPENPFAKDERLRQALSMLNDRDLFIDTFYNTERFSAEGLTQPRRWHTVIPIGYDDFWLDPRDQAKFGENAKYFKYDAAEAKKLAQAATGGKVIESDFVYRTRDAQFNRMAEVTQAMWEATGDFKFSLKALAENEWRANYNRNYGKFIGAAMGPVQAGPDVDSQIVGRLLPDTDRTGNIMLGDNAALVKFIEDQRKELDFEKRKQIIYELQRYCAKKQVFLMDAGEALGYTLAWSWLNNFHVYRIWTGDAEATGVDPHLWVDESKRNA